MPIDDIKATQAVAAYGQQKKPFSKEKKKKFADFLDDEKSNDPYNDENDFSDQTSILGIPASELTPNVSSAIEGLMKEISELRIEISHNRALEEMMSDTMDHHRDLPVMTRHALIRELSICLSKIDNTINRACFICIQISNLKDIRTQYGLLASDSILRQCAEIVVQYVRQTDDIGTLGGDGFGMILTLADDDEAKSKIEAIKNRIESFPFIWELEQLDVHLSYGICEITSDQTVTDIIKLADMDLRDKLLRQ